MIRDRIVFGISSEKIRAKLIEQGDKLTLTKAIEICQSYEYAQSQLNQIKPKSQTMVNALKTKSKSSHQHQASKSPIKYTCTSGAKQTTLYRRPTEGASTNRGTTSTGNTRGPTSGASSRDRKCGHCGVSGIRRVTIVQPKESSVTNVTSGTILQKCVGCKM
ncbi:hypothetical protein DPMN_134448 [Dreissena polymorpha]|uniref:Uncharacterized protein n=1 Tax=Dreissena polymorpha TaxID=45954 RepID=A0A9D4JEW7_DREPO|nr:hypothetical protein DPMN_134448 [Dreissena polymorpha]